MNAPVALSRTLDLSKALPDTWSPLTDSTSGLALWSALRSTQRLYTTDASYFASLKLSLFHSTAGGLRSPMNVLLLDRGTTVASFAVDPGACLVGCGSLRNASAFDVYLSLLTELETAMNTAGLLDE